MSFLTCAFTFGALVPPAHQQPRQRTHVRVVLTGPDVAGGARTHGPHVVHCRLDNGGQDGLPGTSIPGAVSSLRRRGLGV